jgi:signal transduction histidine kinase
MLNFIILGLVGILLWWLLVPGLFTANTIIVINVIYGFIAASVILLVAALIRSWKADRTSVLFYAAAFGMNVVAALMLIAEEYGAIHLAWLPLSPIFIGSLFEIIIFAIGLSYRSKLIGDDRKKLLSNINSLQQQAMQAFVRGMEEEKVRVANELHDDVASRLSLLKMKAADGAETELAEQIAEISDGVRRISHQLNPVSLNSETVLQKIQELISEHRQAGTNIDFQFFDVEKSISEEVGLQLYRILQEALNNIQKHAKAQHVDLQIFVHDNELVMTIEDDGSGFDMAKQRTGLGTKNMRLRTEQVGGEFSISSAVDDGTSIMVTIPLS